MSDNESNESRETVADIVAMLRANARGERFDEFSFTSLADRLEAAAKRDEERAVEHATRYAEAVARDNCDKMPDIDNLTMHDLAQSPCKSTLEYASREELLALVRWLLAPAAERKGDGDGR